MTDWQELGPRDSQRRYRTLEVNPSLLALIFGKGTGEAKAVEEVDDLRIVAVRFEYWRDRLEFLVASESFEPVPENQLPPSWTPSYTREAAAV